MPRGYVKFVSDEARGLVLAVDTEDLARCGVAYG
jgi:hypothetical protein